jgi:transcription elongation factor Elf1
MTKCPKCEHSITHVQLEKISVKSKTDSWVGVSYSCPYCHSVLSVGIDPLALKADTVSEVADRLRKG